jgi:dTDP-4-dehydrorhamnose reductase
MGGKNGMKALVTGAGGMLAHDLVPCLLKQGFEVHAPPHHKLDITDLQVARAVVDDFRPSLIFNCAAYTRVDDAEKQVHEAFIVNGLGVQNLCLLCQEYDAILVHFSTDYVFDGTKSMPYGIYDEPNPVNTYGRSKLLGERYILWLLNRFYIIRTSWLFGLHGRNFVENMLELGQKQKEIPVVADQKGCPTWTKNLAESTISLIQTGRYGIYHITNSGATSWFEFTREVFRLAGTKTEVLPVTSEEFPRPARRPKNSVLDPFPLPLILGKEMPSWEEALAEYISLRKARAQ